MTDFQFPSLPVPGDTHSTLFFHEFDDFVVVQFPHWVQLFAIPWTVARQAFLFFTISWSLLKFVSTESVMLSSHLILCWEWK